MKNLRSLITSSSVSIVGLIIFYLVYPFTQSAAQAGPSAAQRRLPQAVTPRITSPLNNATYVFGEPIAFSAVDDGHTCAENAYQIGWTFEQDGHWLPGAYNFIPARMLDFAGGTHLMPLPGVYRVKVEMCGIESPIIKFTVRYDTPLVGQHHPDFADNDIIFPCIDWDDADASANHLTSAHFNIYWNTTGSTCDPAPSPVAVRVPTNAEIGLLECTYANLSRWMTSPLANNSIYRHVAAYDGLTHIPFYMGLAGGGGGGIPQGLYFGVGVNNRIFAHELFHVFDYAGNPLHEIYAFDWRYENNPYHFYHESVSRIQQTMAKDSTKLWGYRTDNWPVWAPVDLGLLELDYDAGPFWAFLMDFYGDGFAAGGRETWEGPAFDACNQQVEFKPGTNEAYRPHTFKFFEAWNAQVRSDVLQEMNPRTDLVRYPWDFCHVPAGRPDSSFLYVGQDAPPCKQTLEYEMQVMENLIRGRVNEAGTPLEESLIADYAVQHAKAFPPNSLAQGMPQVISCAGRPGVSFSKGFDAILPGCSTDPDTYGVPPVIPDNLVCQAVIDANQHDFYARIRFRITENTARYLRLQANDDATLYVDGLAVIGQGTPDNSSTADYPNASTTYADQRFQWTRNHAPVSSIFPIGNPLNKTFEIEWVNRGDTQGNDDRNCSADRSRYLLNLEWSSTPLTSTFQTLGADKVEIISSRFWPNQGSGLPGFAPVPPDTAITQFDQYTTPIKREIQLRPVAWLQTPFLLPSLGVNYHPVQCPANYTGLLEAIVRDDLVPGIKSRPYAEVLTLEDQVKVAWWQGAMIQSNAVLQRVALTCDGSGGPATYNGKPAILLVTTRRAGASAANPYGKMGAIHYTVLVKQVNQQVFLPQVKR